MRPTSLFNPSDHPSPPFYSHIAVTRFPSAPQQPTRLITLAGQIGRTKDGLMPKRLPEQVQVALGNVSQCLKAAGATTRDVISIRQYVVALSHSETRRKQLVLDWLEGRGNFFDSTGSSFQHNEAKPPNTVLGVTALAVEGALFEIEVVAAINEPQVS
jgi:enamine deaminase RidA (YjgF/YER057c/UK114 family)